MGLALKMVINMDDKEILMVTNQILAGKLKKAFVVGDNACSVNEYMSKLISVVIERSPKEKLEIITIGEDFYRLENNENKLRYQAVSEPKEGVDILNRLIYEELVNRLTLFDTEDEDQDPVKCFSKYNRFMKRTCRKTMPAVLVIIEEVKTLLNINSEDTEEAIYRLAQLGDMAGIYLMIGTNDASVITDDMKKFIKEWIWI